MSDDTCDRKILTTAQAKKIAQLAEQAKLPPRYVVGAALSLERPCHWPADRLQELRGGYRPGFGRHAESEAGMSARKKPTRPTRVLLVASDSPPTSLTQSEIRWVTAYRMMDQESKDDHLRFAESSANAHPLRGTTALSAANGIRLAAAFGKVVK